nr:tlde1 domain-containing protein [Caballeronia ptereochthonis]
MHGPHGHSYSAVSGRPSKGNRFDYSSSRYGARSEGPIPPGRYWIKPSEMWSNHWYNLAARSAWGDHRITIHIFPGTETHRRGGFFIHGGTHAGSAGCINLHSRMEDFVRDLEAAVGPASDCYVPLTIRY